MIHSIVNYLSIVPTYMNRESSRVCRFSTKNRGQKTVSSDFSEQGVDTSLLLSKWWMVFVETILSLPRSPSLSSTMPWNDLHLNTRSHPFSDRMQVCPPCPGCAPFAAWTRSRSTSSRFVKLLPSFFLFFLFFFFCFSRTRPTRWSKG